jgi:phosphotransferase system  glucose/maltose/N-acetylglucosamine-specific IIC component
MPLAFITVITASGNIFSNGFLKIMLNNTGDLENSYIKR